MYGYYEKISFSALAQLARSGIQSGPVSEGRANEAFKTVRNRLRKYPGTEIIRQCVNILNSPDATNDKMMSRYPPWLMLLLLKWTLLYGDFDSSQLRQFSRTEFEKLIDRLHDYGGQARLPQDASMWFLVFHNYSFQQLWFQRRHDYDRLARQYVMFADAEDTLNDEFLRLTGIKIDHFLELALALLAPVYNQASSTIQTTFFRPLETTYPPGTIDSFLNSISLDIHEARRYLRDLQSRVTPSRFYEYYEEPSLKRFPLLKSGAAFQPYSRHLLYYSLHTFVYDILKAADPDLFMKHFGRLFQSYVHNALDYAKWDYQTEETLKKRFGASAKVVDFLIQHQNTKVLVEAKSGEIADLGKVSHDPLIVRHKIKDSLLKAVEQGYSTAKAMHDICTAQDEQASPNDNCLVVVGFKDFYLGNGRDVYDFIAKDVIDGIVHRYGKEWIPIDHIYFLSIDEFDITVEAFRERPQELVNFLKKAVTADKDPSTKKFVFEQHLQVELGHMEFPAYLLEAENALKERIGHRLTQASSTV